MSEYVHNGDEKLVPSEGYTDDVKPDGSKVFICKQCNKEIKTEQGIKAHIKTKQPSS